MSHQRDVGLDISHAVQTMPEILGKGEHGQLWYLNHLDNLRAASRYDTPIPACHCTSHRQRPGNCSFNATQEFA